MPRKLLVAVLHAPTDEGHWGTKSAAERLEVLDSLLAERGEGLDESYGGEAVTDLRAIAALPENFFTRKIQSVDEWGVRSYVEAPEGMEEYDIQMTRENATTLMKSLKDVSAKPANRGVLVFAGTIAYRVPLTRRVAHRTGVAIDARLANLRRQQRTVEPGFDADYIGRERTRLAAKKDELAANVEGLADGRKSYAAYNTCNVYLNGGVELHYNKHAGYQEVISQVSSVIFSPGQTRGEFACDGFEFGLEICRDHHEGVLKSRADRRTFDVQVVLSANVEEVGGHLPLNDGGYFIHSSAQERLCVVKRKRAVGGLATVDFGDPVTINECSAMFADIQLAEAV